MSRSKKCFSFQEDYANFETPYTGIATMVFVQAVSDLSYLNGREWVRKDGTIIRKWEIINFFRSKWCAVLASALGVDGEALNALVEGAI